MVQQAEGSFSGRVSMQECQVLMEEAMEMMEQTIQTDAKQKVCELSELNDSTVELRNFVAVLSIAFAPLILVALLGVVFLASCCVKAYGVSMLFVCLSLFCVLYSLLACLTLMHQRQQREPFAEQQADHQQQQGVYARLQQVAGKLKTQASVYDNPAERAAFCQTPWLASVALLGIEASIAAAFGYFAAFLQAFSCSLAAALGSGALLGHMHGTLGPPSATQLEVAMAALARCPWVAQSLAALAILAEPFVEESCPSAAELQTLGAQKLEKGTVYLQKVEDLHNKLRKRTGRVLETAVSMEKLIGGTSEEREKSIQDLTEKMGANWKGMACAATKVLGVGPQEGEERQEMKDMAAGLGDIAGGTLGLALNQVGMSRDETPAAKAEQVMRGVLPVFRTWVKRHVELQGVQEN